MNEYFVYILTNYKKSVLYTVITNDLTRRLYEHKNSNDKNSFTTRYKCYYLIYWDKFNLIEQAITREKQIKGWTRIKKEKLITDFNIEWKFLNDEVN
jgi:putative endonuclease